MINPPSFAQHHAAVACRLGLEGAGVGERMVTVLASGDAPVLVAREWVTRGVVVQDDNTARIPYAGDLEYLAGVDDEALGVLM